MPRAECPSESGVASSRAGTGIHPEAYSAVRRLSAPCPPRRRPSDEPPPRARPPAPARRPGHRRGHRRAGRPAPAGRVAGRRGRHRVRRPLAPARRRRGPPAHPQRRRPGGLRARRPRRRRAPRRAVRARRRRPRPGLRHRPRRPLRGPGLPRALGRRRLRDHARRARAAASRACPTCASPGARAPPCPPSPAGPSTSPTRSSSLQHLEREDAFALLRDLRRALRPGGRAFLTFPNLLSDAYLAAFVEQVDRGEVANPARARAYTPQEVERLLPAAGLPIERLDAGVEIVAVCRA